MKKVFLLATFALVGFYSNAQKITYGVTGGITSASNKVKADNTTTTSNSKIGITLGGYANISVADNISIQPGLNFTQKGGKLSETGLTSTTTLNYLEIPINALYSLKAGSGNVILGAGPTISYALSGKTKTSFEGQSETEDVKFGSNDDEVKPLELGLNIVAGYKLPSGLSFNLNYNMGSNLSNVSGVKSNNRYFGIRVGYEFGSK